MGLLYDFTDLISKYSVEGRLIRESSQGEYIGGNWVPASADEPKPVKGAFLPMTRQKVYQSGGAYTENDRELITLEEIPLEPSAYVVFSGILLEREADILSLCNKKYLTVKKIIRRGEWTAMLTQVQNG